MKDPVSVQECTPAERVLGFDEVVLGYTEEQAVAEAKRCLQCKDPACIFGCPVGIDIKTFIRQIAEKDPRSAFFTIKEKNNFPSICGRVCPAEYQCRKACVLTKKGEPFASAAAINIHFLERFAGDFGIAHDLRTAQKTVPELRHKKAAVVGAGPAGLCCAGELARAGVQVTVFEGLHTTGGVLRYGIPPFRLPHRIMDQEITSLRGRGVVFELNTVIGRTKTLRELFDTGFSAVFLGLGAGTPSFLNVPGESLCNVYSANEFLTRVNLMGAYEFPRRHTPLTIGEHIVVIGGGNTAMDAARVALRLQKMNGMSPDTTVVYRRTELEMPARRLEIEHAKEEGVRFSFLVQPTGFLSGREGCVGKMRALVCELGEPDSSGRRKPVPVKGSDFEIACDVAVIAAGLQANTMLTRVTPELIVDKWKDIVVDPGTMQTSVAGVYAGGDIVGGEGTVIEAMGMAKRAARAMVAYLRKQQESA